MFLGGLAGCFGFAFLRGPLLGEARVRSADSRVAPCRTLLARSPDDVALRCSARGAGCGFGRALPSSALGAPLSAGPEAALGRVQTGKRHVALRIAGPTVDLFRKEPADS